MRICAAAHPRFDLEADIRPDAGGTRKEETRRLERVRRDISAALKATRPPQPGPDWTWCAACEEWEPPR